MRVKILAITAFLLVPLFISSCVSTGQSGFAGSTSLRAGGSHDRVGARYLAYMLKSGLRHPEVIDQPVVITTFVDLNNLDNSSVFGRFLAERLISEMHGAGFTVAELRKGKDIFIRKQLGEVILTRDAKEALNRIKARSIIAGTYVATEDRVMVNVRMIDVATPIILSSSSYTLPMNKHLRRLLTGESPF